MGTCKSCGEVVSSVELKDGLCKNCYSPKKEDDLVGKYKIISHVKDIELKVKDGSKIYSDLEEKVNRYAANGWEVVGVGPEKNALLKRGFLVELLRGIPLINILIDWLFPQIAVTSVSIILRKD